MKPPLSAEQVKDFADTGLLVIKSFFDVPEEIEPVQRGIHSIIGILLDKYRIRVPRTEFSASTFDAGYLELIAHDRAYGGEVYDAVKQIPALLRLVASVRLEALVAQLRETTAVGVAARSYGIRIDNPREERYRATWHQEYPSHLRSLDGITFWSPLLPITESLGPVKYCVGSHKAGPEPVRFDNSGDPDKAGSRGMTLVNAKELVEKYPPVSPLTEPGDLVVADFLTVHASGMNREARPRWSMQFRHFNFRDPTGIRIGWQGSFAAGGDLRRIHPALVID